MEVCILWVVVVFVMLVSVPSSCRMQKLNSRMGESYYLSACIDFAFVDDMCSVFKERFNVSWTAFATNHSHHLSHCAFSQYPHDSFWKCRHILGGRYDIECDGIDIKMPEKYNLGLLNMPFALPLEFYENAVLDRISTFITAVLTSVTTCINLLRVWAHESW